MNKQGTLYKKLIDATLSEISENGIEMLTAKKISERANTSTGIIYHHFGTKEELVLATYTELTNDLTNRIDKVRKKYPKDPVKRLKETMLVSFDKDLINNDNKSGWTQLWASSVCDEKINKLVESYYESLYSVIKSDLLEFCDETSAREYSLSLMSMIHGYWIEIMIAKNATVEEAINASNKCIDNANKVQHLKSII